MSLPHQRSILLLAEWTDPGFIHGVAAYAKTANWHLNIDYVGGRRLPPSWKGDGCIHMVESQEATDFIAALNVPQPIVAVDGEALGRQAADYFLSLGFRNFACYTSDSAAVTSARAEAFQQRLSGLGTTTTVIARETVRACEESDWDERKAWLIRELARLPKPLAIFCADDRLALRIVDACMAGSIDIPNEVAVLGVGNLAMACDCSAVPLSSIRIDFAKLGYERAAQLDRLINGESCRGIKITPSGIEVRRSTYTLAVESPAGRQALRFMLDNFASPIGLPEICAAGRLTRRQLTHITRDELNTSPGKLLEDIRLRKACYLLRTTDYPVKRIAYETGLGNALRLQRIFRKQLNCSPTAWRKEQDKEAIPRAT